MKHKGIRTLKYDCGCKYSYRMGMDSLIEVTSTWCDFHATDIWRRFPGKSGAMSKRIWAKWKRDDKPEES